MPKRFRKKRPTVERPVLPPDVRLTFDPERLEIVYTNKRWLMGIVVGIFGFLWTSFVVQIPADLIRREAFSKEILLTIPFFLASLFLLFLFMRCILHRETLRIDENGLDWRMSFFLPLLRRKVAWDDLVAVNAGTHTGNERALIRGWGVEIETSSKTFHAFLDMEPWSGGKNVREILARYIADYRLRHDLSPPTKETVKTRRHGALQLTQSPDRLEIQGVPHASFEERCFTVVWLTGWTIACVVLTYCLLFVRYEPPGQAPLWFMLLILALFWSVWAYMGSMMLARNFRWETLRLDSDGLFYQLEIRIPFLFRHIVFKRRRIPLPEARLVETFCSANEIGIEIPTTGLPLQCFRHLPGHGCSKAFLKPLNERLEQLGVTEKSRRQGTTKSDTAPFDARWRPRNDTGTPAFTRRGWIPPKQIVGLLFICFFWNTIVSILATAFIGGAVKTEIIVLCVIASLFFSPFIAVGLVIFLATIMSLLQYACRYSILFEPEGLRVRRRWFGIGRGVLYPWNRIGTVAVVRHQSIGWWKHLATSLRNPETTGGDDGVNPYPFAVRLSDRDGGDGKPLGIIRDLLESEARYFAGQIRRWKNEASR